MDPPFVIANSPRGDQQTSTEIGTWKVLLLWIFALNVEHVSSFCFFFFWGNLQVHKIIIFIQCNHPVICMRVPSQSKKIRSSVFGWRFEEKMQFQFQLHSENRKMSVCCGEKKKNSNHKNYWNWNWKFSIPQDCVSVLRGLGILWVCNISPWQNSFGILLTSPSKSIFALFSYLFSSLIPLWSTLIQTNKQTKKKKKKKK